MSQIEFIRGLRGLSSSHRGCVLTIGAFDGIHRGHQQLLSHVLEKSAELKLPSTVILFEPQPNEYFQRETAPARLMRLREKVAALQDIGINRVLCLRFNTDLRQLSAQAFIDRVLIEGLGVRYLVVGDDFRFGCDRNGDFSLLKEQGEFHGFEVCDTRTQQSGEDRISSTRVRSLLEAGELAGARDLLGDDYSNIGRVVYGRQLGRELGFPTVNIALGRMRSPLFGVFAVKVESKSSSYLGVANVGVRPTISGSEKPLLEVHLFDTNDNLYGEFLKVRYLKKIRDEMKFENLDALKAQISLDVEQARLYFKSESI